jgi:hypothetical protein
LDEAAEPSVLLKLFEQATFIRPELDPSLLTNAVMTEFLKDLVDLLLE